MNAAILSRPLPAALPVLMPLLMAACMTTFGTAAVAQDLRDPTRAPAALEAAPSETPDALPVGSEGLSVVVRDGKPMLVVGTRLHAVGQQVGSYKIERITETEVWLRDGKGLRKLPRFGGIQRKVLAAEECPRPVANATAKSANAKSATAKPGTTKAAKPVPNKTPARASQPRAAASAPATPANPVTPCEPSPP